MYAEKLANYVCITPSILINANTACPYLKYSKTNFFIIFLSEFYRFFYNDIEVTLLVTP